MLLPCPKCGKLSHKWKKIYYEKYSMLKVVDNLFISWCEESNDYVITSKSNVLLNGKKQKNT